MKKLDLKSILTISLIVVLEIIILAATFAWVFLGKSDIFQAVFTLFTNVVTTCTAYYFTRKTNDNEAQAS